VKAFRTEPPLPRSIPGRVTSPAQKLTPDFRSFLLLEEAWYTWWHREQLLRLVVPADFTHDFASVPRPLWTLISPLDLGLASIFHDWLYRTGGRVTTLRWLPEFDTCTWEEVRTPWTRVQADELFARMMREQGVVKWRRRAAYLAVRVAGRAHWREADVLHEQSEVPGPPTAATPPGREVPAPESLPARPHPTTIEN